MRFAIEALRHVLMPKGSLSLSALFAFGGAALAMVIVIFGALLGTGQGSAEAQADAVAVNGSTFTPVSATPPMPAPAAKPEGAPAPRFDDAVSVTRAVQTELKRARCYSGPINGVWTASTRAAMGEFTARVNARLPVDHADPVLLALLETHNKISCTAECNAGVDGGQGCKGRRTLPRSELASIAEEKPAETRAELPPPLSPEPVKADANDLDLSSRNRRAPDPVAPVETASVEPIEASVSEASALPAAVAPAPKVNKPERRRTTRRYRKNPSIPRSVQRGLNSLQRSINQLF